MKRFISVLYSFAAGLEQACSTYETIKQANKAALLITHRNVPEVKSPIGFTGFTIQENPATTFTAEKP
jgi:hypothetical protein